MGDRRSPAAEKAMTEALAQKAVVPLDMQPAHQEAVGTPGVLRQMPHASTKHQLVLRVRKRFDQYENPPA